MSGNSINFYFEIRKVIFLIKLSSDLNFYNTRIFGGDNYSSKRNVIKFFNLQKRYILNGTFVFNSFINLVFSHTNFRPFTEDGSYGALYIKEQKINYLRVLLESKLISLILQ